MENENNNLNQESGSTYHYGRNENPFGREDVSGRTTFDNGNTGNHSSANDNVNHTEDTYYQNASQNSSSTGAKGTNPYQQGSVYGQGIYTGNNFAAEEIPKKKKAGKEKKPSKGVAKKIIKFTASAAAFGLIAGSVMVGVNAVGSHFFNNGAKTPQIGTVTPTDTGNRQESKNSVSQVVEEVTPSIVAITSTSVQTVRSWFQSYEQEVSGSGSGIIIGQTDNEIMLVTNYHVIEGAKELTVAFCDKSAVAATVKGYDEAADLAVLTVNTKDMEKDTLSQIKVAALGSSEDLKVGEAAIAIGNALGYGQSVTGGYISALNREVELENKTMTLLQTDAAINPGNSGGALLNENGEVIGINTVKYVDSTVEGMGYAIPISAAIPIINDLMNQEVIKESEQGYLGIRGNDVTDEYTQGFNMPNGVYVVKIVEDSPADQCGLKAGDIITKFGDRDVTSMDALESILSNKKAGEKIKMTVQRNDEKGEYEEVTLEVTLGAKKDMPKDNSDQKSDKESTQDSRQQMIPDDGIENWNPFQPNN